MSRPAARRRTVWASGWGGGLRRLLRPRAVLRTVALVGAVAAPWLLDGYATALLGRALGLGLVAVSVALLTGVVGLPTLGQTAPFAAGTYACAILGQHTGSVGPAQLALGAAVGAGFALLTAPLVVPARGVTALMITLAIAELTVTVAGRWRSVTGGTDGIAGLTATRPFWGMSALDSDRDRYLYALVVVAVLVGALWAVLRTRVGPLLRACRDDAARMRASGHPVAAYLCVTLVVAGALAGVAGSLLVTTEQYASPADFGFEVGTLLLLGVVIGGTESLVGAIAATVLVVAARDWLSGLLPGQAPVLLGVLFVLAAYLMPSGAPLPGRPPAPASRTRWLAPIGRLARPVRPPAAPVRAVSDSSDRRFSAGPAPRTQRTPIGTTHGAAANADRGNAPGTTHGAAASGNRGNARGTAKPLLTVDRVSRRYGSLTALDSVDLCLFPGDRHALIGPNGAGKSTLLDLIAGVRRPDTGRIAFAGRDITRLGPARRARLGVARTHQRPAVWASLTAVENLLIAGYPSAGGWVPEPASTTLERVGLAAEAGTLAAHLSHGQRRQLEIAIALVGAPRLLLLDEPAAGLSVTEYHRLWTVLHRLPRTVTVLLVEHRLDLVYALADTVTVLRDGRPVASGAPTEIQRSREVRRAYAEAIA